MPQMAPMWWTTLLIMFNMLFMITFMITYFQVKNSSISLKQNTKSIKKFNWKW